VPATWNWDNVRMCRAVKFGIIDGNRDDVSANTRGLYSTAGAEGACLRFVGIGRPIDVRFNGRSWRRAALPEHLTSEVQFNEFGSYMMPLPVRHEKCHVPRPAVGRTGLAGQGRIDLCSWRALLGRFES
jgi:hypothetical protein